MKTLKLLVLALTLLSGLSLSVLSQGPAVETAKPVLPSLESKLDVILRRLDAIESRLQRLEMQRSFQLPVGEATTQEESKDIPTTNWYRPRNRSVPTSLDAGMLIDGIERAQAIESLDAIDPLQNILIPKHDGVIVEEPIRRRK